jgi:bifunctional N-acetylglucosamine-1-phosphate-uridyltransferase/glucosamine-1-phosphate-acetyltransferase GlmU-like protein
VLLPFQHKILIAGNHDFLFEDNSALVKQILKDEFPGISYLENSGIEINEINCGIYAINTSYLCKYLPSLNNNNSQKEYYLTDIIEIIKREEQIEVGSYEMPQEDQYETTGVNTLEQLKELEKICLRNGIKNKIE